ncbi:flippase [Rossellomorea vietnamensis]|uniref:Polysaccharide biosynthesis protein n=1 Tax=Rossellomorea vietnamensis TaxID=218284 RepID=A0A0N8GGS1_9BACI|nr:flippase [Rossellomorea vietnamensis]KPL59282.1 polysaccharide biosynthesis protein [Rossellomorea vietnamensis]
MKLIFKNATYLFLSNFIVRLFTAISSILIARSLGASDFGILSIGLAIASIAGYFSDMGLSHTFIREVSKNNNSKNLSVLVSSHIRIKLVFSLIVGIVVYFLIHNLYSDVYVRNILYLMVFPTIVGGSLQGIGAVYFQAIEQMHFTAIIRSVSGIITAVSLIIGLLFEWELSLVAPIYGFSSILGGIYSIYLLSKRTSLFGGWDRRLLKGLAGFTINGLLFMLLPQIPPIVLEKVSSLEEVGYFSAAYKIPSVLYQVPGVIAAAFYPILFSLGTKNLSKHREMTLLQLKVMSFLGIIMFLPLFLYSEWWSNIIFGEEWKNVGSILRILSFVVLFQSISFPLADSLTTTDKQSKRIIVMTIAVCTAIILYFILGYYYGSVGGAISMVSIEAFIFIGYSIYIKKSSALLLQSLRYNILSVLIVIFTFNILSELIHPFIGSIGSIVFFITIIIIFDKEVIRAMRRTLRKKIEG